MNNTIAWILTTFVIMTIILDLSTFILMKTNNKAYEQNGNNPRKGKVYWTYLVVSRLALAMTFVAGALIVSIGFIVLSNLMAQHKTIATYIITACICLTIASGTWCAIKRDIDANQNADPDELEPFIDPKRSDSCHRDQFLANRQHHPKWHHHHNGSMCRTYMGVKTLITEGDTTA